jgi:V8-like Glu-specific endopeptidase
LRAVRLALVLFLALGTQPRADETRRILDDSEAEEFRGVGRLNISGSRFCTATLISEREVLTAAHCLFNPKTGRRVPDGFLRFVAGQVRDTYAVLAEVARSAPLTGYGFSQAIEYEDVRIDLALIELKEPVAPELALPLATGAMEDGAASVTIVSYARDRAYTPSIQQGCPVVAMNDGVAVIGCEVTRGISGSPVMAGEGGDRRLVAVVSAMGSGRDGAPLALSVISEPRLAELRRSLAEQGLDGNDGASHLRPVRRP